MILKLGSTGLNVTRLQEALKIDSDGRFGPNTQNRVREFQRSRGLNPTGEVDSTTWSALFPSTGIQFHRLEGSLPSEVFVQLEDTAGKFNITTPLRLSHFLAQCAHESGGFRAVVENLNYSADRLRQIFPRHFPGNLSASYAGNPERIASRVYASRMGNGPEASGDGWRFRGRGYIQLTGRENYSRFSRFIGEDVVQNPDLVSTKYPLASAAFFFNSNGLWTICDRGDTSAIVEALTRRVNGGTHGLDDRIQRFGRFWNLLR